VARADAPPGEPIGKTEKNLKVLVTSETYEYAQMYPGTWRRPRGTRGWPSSPSGSRHCGVVGRRTPRPRPSAGPRWD